MGADFAMNPPEDFCAKCKQMIPNRVYKPRLRTVSGKPPYAYFHAHCFEEIFAAEMDKMREVAQRLVDEANRA